MPNAAGKRMLEALATIASAHPHGPIQIEVLAATERPGRGAARCGNTRAEHIKAALAPATDPTRLVLVPSGSDAAASAHARVVFAAYAHGGTVP